MNDLTVTSRRENPILEPVFDELKRLVDYTEVSLYSVEDGCCSLVTYRGPVPQAQALSLSFTPTAEDVWRRALTTGKPAIGEHTDAAMEAIAAGRKPFEDLLGVSADMRPMSQLTIPLGRGTPRVYLLTLGHVKPGFYTSQHAALVADWAAAHMSAFDGAARFAQMAQRAAEAEILLAAQRTIGARLELGEVLRLLADEACRVTFARTAFILSLDGEDLVLEAWAGESKTVATIGGRWPVERAAIATLSCPLTSRRDDPARYVGPNVATRLGARDWLAAPLRLVDQTTGLLVVLEKRLGTFGPGDERRLAALASAASVCLDNARLYQQARRVAALEERDRLAREMHDELAQALGYLKMQASVIDLRLAAGDVSAAWAGLGELTGVLNSTYSAVREAIFGLRNPVATQQGFFASLPGYLADYRTVYGLNVSLDVSLDQLPALEPDVELQLARIVQESLANVRRHASATQAWVQVERRVDALVVRIGDDGRGFDVDAVLARGGHCFGLQVMRERAQSFGGRVETRSAPGQGTEVTVIIPES